MKIHPLLTASIILVASHSATKAETFRYRLSGDWSKVAGASDAGWGVNPNDDGTVGTTLPGAEDDARINWGGNTVTISNAAPAVKRVEIGVDESGTVVVAGTGSLTASNDVIAGNNNPNAIGRLIVQSGGKVNVGNILWAANENSEGMIDVQTGGIITVASHLWWGVSGKATVTISGEINQTGGILGLGTKDAATASGGNASVNIMSGGKLNLNNISGDPETASIQPGSKIEINSGGLLTIKGDVAGAINNYIAKNEIVGIGGTLQVAFDAATNLTSVSVKAGETAPTGSPAEQP
ncbi:MAG: hypothetical protein ACO3F7_02185 [Luteolibacter sp.]